MITYYKNQKQEYIDNLKSNGKPIPKRTTHDNVIEQLQIFADAIECDEDSAYCNRDKKYYNIEEIEVCECCDQTFHKSNIVEISNNDGSFYRSCDNCESEMRARADDANDPRYDDKQPYDRF